MLILQRKKGQSILIGDNISVTISEITSDGVKLAIDAPKDVIILREELAEAIKVNKQSVADKASIESLKNFLKEK